MFSTIVVGIDGRVVLGGTSDARTHGLPCALIAVPRAVAPATQLS